MCYAKPGPRCYSSFEAAIIKQTKSVIASYEELSNIQKNDGTTQADLEKAIQKRVIETKKLRELEASRDATAGGIKRLEKEYEEIVSEDHSQEELNEISDKLNKAQNRFNQELYAYDELNDTVNGKTPSPIISDRDYKKNLKHLINQREKAKVLKNTIRLLHEEKNPANDDDFRKKVKSLKNKQEEILSLTKKMEHSILTRQHIKDGVITDPRTRDDWLKEATALREEEAENRKNNYTAEAERISLKASYATRMSSIAASGYKATMPSLTDSKGNVADYALDYNEAKRKWVWKSHDNDESKTMDMTSDGKAVYLNRKTGEQETFTMEEREQPAIFKTLLRPNGKYSNVLMANHERIKHNPSLVK